MQNQNYTATIEVAKSPKDVLNHINDVSKWWSKDYAGSSIKLNDEFIIQHSDRHYSKQKLVKLFPTKRLYGL